MWAGLLLDTVVPFLTGGGGAALAWYMRGAMGKVRDPKPKVTGKSEADLIADGWKLVDKMTKDIHGLYHPPGCKCVWCELRADDAPPQRTGELCQNACFGCSVLTCDSHPDHAKEPNFVVMVDGQPVPARVSVETPEEPDREVSPDYVRALKQKLDGLRKENAELRKGNGQKVITKVQERKTPLQNKIEQVMQHTSQGPVKLTLDPSDMTNGHPMEIIVGPQVEPESVIEQFGGDIVRKNYPRPQSGPGSKELGIMDRQLGTIGRICDRCGEGKAWKIVGDRHICKQCFYTMPQSDVTSIRQEGGRKYVCYRDGHCEVT